MRGKAYIISRLVASACLLIGGVALLLANSIWGYFQFAGAVPVLYSALRDLLVLIRGGKIPIREDERTRMIFDKSARNGFFLLLSAVLFIPVLYEMTRVDIVLISTVVFVVGFLVFLFSLMYYGHK
jgi:hypothetical protein